jgi:ABC-type multidrug transport system ATPase subunit
MLSGVIQSSSGSIKVAGQSLEGDISYIQSLIGLCSQEDLLLPGFTALDHIRFLSEFCGVEFPAEGIRKYAESMLSKVDLQADMDLEVQIFSGGMKRRLSLVLALIGAKPIVFLDEPTTGLVTLV